MPQIRDTLLKGNYGAAVVMARLSSRCLVRPVTADTDVGVDLYCESVDEGKPFLHFWLQVKAGEGIKVLDDDRASYPFEADHLNYWFKQPVPVFAALVHTSWPPDKEPKIYVVDITTQLLFQGIPKTSTKTLASDYVWNPGQNDDLDKFFEEILPNAEARLHCSKGIVPARQTSTPQYVQKSPTAPVWDYQDEIFMQLRRTAVNSILFLYYHSRINKTTYDFRRKLTGIVEQIDDTSHYENFFAKAISFHADQRFTEAKDQYQAAIDCINRDPSLPKRDDWPDWLKKIEEIKMLKQKAEDNDPLMSNESEDTNTATGDAEKE